jgi:hypothetical protein
LVIFLSILYYIAGQSFLGALQSARESDRIEEEDINDVVTSTHRNLKNDDYSEKHSSNINT